MFHNLNGIVTSFTLLYFSSSYKSIYSIKVFAEISLGNQVLIIILGIAQFFINTLFWSFYIFTRGLLLSKNCCVYYPILFFKYFIYFLDCARSQLGHMCSLIVVCEIQFPDQGLNLGPLHWGHSLNLHLCSCPAIGFICTIFLNSTYMH